MATTLPSFAHTQPISSLDTYNHTVSTANVYTPSIKIFNDGSPAGMSVVIKKNGTTIATSATAIANTSFIFIDAPPMYYAVNDVITWVVSSTTNADAATPGQFMGIISFASGSAQ